MHLFVAHNLLHIQLSRWERVWALHGDLRIPLTNIEGAHTERPQSIWREVRAPGSRMPGLIKAGTYHLWQERTWASGMKKGPRGRYREFWYATRGNRDRFLVLKLREHRYRRIVLTMPDNEEWARRINAALERAAA